MCQVDNAQLACPGLASVPQRCSINKRAKQFIDGETVLPLLAVKLPGRERGGAGNGARWGKRAG